jgi:hypothetical protein
MGDDCRALLHRHCNRHRYCDACAAVRHRESDRRAAKRKRDRRRREREEATIALWEEGALSSAQTTLSL